MRTKSLDRRVRKEARILVRTAQAALAEDKSLHGKAGSLREATDEVAAALDKRDLQKVRRALPTLDALVDELCRRPARSAARDYVESIGTAILIALALRAFVIEAFKIPSSSMYPTLEINDHIFVNKFLYGLRIPWTDIKLFQLRGPKRGEVIVFIKPCEPDRDFIKRVIATAGQTVEVRCNVVYVDGKAIQNDLVAAPITYEDRDENHPDEGWRVRQVSLYRETVDGFTYETYHDEGRPKRDEQNRAATDGAKQPDSHDFPSLIGSEIPGNVCDRIVDPKTGSPLKAPNQKASPSVRSKYSADPCEQQLHYVVPEGHVFAMGDNRSNSTDSRYWGSVPIENIKGKALFIWLSYQEFGLTGFRWSRIGSFVH